MRSISAEAKRHEEEAHEIREHDKNNDAATAPIASPVHYEIPRARIADEADGRRDCDALEFEVT